ncbi:MAG: hypothetical protein NTX00_00240 [Candidatus Parcubacteria bacterium]|nr:hypothetical protein [Candidatus Parcubacteria bacterium]
MPEILSQPELPTIADTLSELEFYLNFESDRGAPVDYSAKIENSFKALKRESVSASLEDKERALDQGMNFFYPNNPEKINKEIIEIYSQLGDLAIEKLASKIDSFQKEGQRDEWDQLTQVDINLYRAINLGMELSKKVDHEKMGPLILSYIGVLQNKNVDASNVEKTIEAMSGMAECAVRPVVSALRKEALEADPSAINNLTWALKSILRNKNINPPERVNAINALIELFKIPDKRCEFTIGVEEALADQGEAAISPLREAFSDADEDRIVKIVGVFLKMTKAVDLKHFTNLVPLLESKIADGDLKPYTLGNINELLDKLKALASH